MRKRARRGNAKKRGLAVGVVVLCVGLLSAGAWLYRDDPQGVAAPSQDVGNVKSMMRTYYIAADQVPWNYAPDGHDDITGKPFDDVSNTYVKSGPGRIGSTYVKCLYHGYS